MAYSGGQIIMDFASVAESLQVRPDLPKVHLCDLCSMLLSYVLDAPSVMQSTLS